MSIKKKVISAGLVSAFIATSFASHAQINLNIQTSMPNGGCLIKVPGGNAPGLDKPMGLQFSYRVSDGNMGMAVQVNGWPKAQQADPNKNIPITLSFDTGTSTTSRSGGYSSGFNDELWGGWGPGEASDNYYAMLKDASSVTVSADNEEIGTFDLQMKGYIHAWIDNCVKQQTGG